MILKSSTTVESTQLSKINLIGLVTNLVGSINSISAIQKQASNPQIILLFLYSIHFFSPWNLGYLLTISDVFHATTTASFPRNLNYQTILCAPFLELGRCNTLASSLPLTIYVPLLPWNTFRLLVSGSCVATSP